MIGHIDVADGIAVRFKGLDLNLLVVMDVLLAERNVSAAADKLCLSQSATSGALARLREYFGDELLVQVGRKMVPTPRAIELSGRVRAALAQIDGTIIQAPEFDPRTARREIRIVASDYLAIAALSKAVGRIEKEAPNITLVIRAPTDKPREELERGEIDLLAMPEGFLSPDHPSLELFTDHYVVVADAGNREVGNTIDEDQFFAMQHVAVKFPTHTPTHEAWFLETRGRERRIGAVAGSFSTVPFLLRGSNRIALMPSRLAEGFAAMMPLRILPSPVEIGPLVECLQWHTYAGNDECLAWVRSEIAAEPH